MIKLVSKEFAPGGLKKKQPQIFQIVKEGKRINLYKFHPFFVKEKNKDETSITNFVLQKTGEELVSLSVANTKFLNWKKGLENYFGDCEYMKMGIELGDFKRHAKGIKKAVNTYEKCQ